MVKSAAQISTEIVGDVLAVHRPFDTPYAISYWWSFGTSWFLSWTVSTFVITITQIHKQTHKFGDYLEDFRCLYVPV